MLAEMNFDDEKSDTKGHGREAYGGRKEEEEEESDDDCIES